MLKVRTAASILFVAAPFWCSQAQGKERHRKHPVMVMTATAFARTGEHTAAGTRVREGIAAADPALLPLGTRIRITGAGAYNGNYLVTDTGAAVNGRHIDLYVPSASEATQFGTKKVWVRVVKRGEGKADAREKDLADRRAPER